MAARRGLAPVAAFLLGCGASAPAAVTATETTPPEPISPPCAVETEALDASVVSAELAASLAGSPEGDAWIEVGIDRVLRIASCGAGPELLVIELHADERSYGTATAAMASSPRAPVTWPCLMRACRRARESSAMWPPSTRSSLWPPSAAVTSIVRMSCEAVMMRSGARDRPE